MRLTPLDIRKQEFKKAMRGLDPEEVYAFLSTIADEYEAVLNDNKALRERLVELDDKVQEYRSMEKTLRDTLLTAERATSDAKDNARREAELIIKQAEIDAEKTVRDIKDNAAKLRQEVQSLKRQRDSYLARMKMLAESQIKFLETAEDDFRDDDARLDEVDERVARHVGESPRRAARDVRPAPAPKAPVDTKPATAPPNPARVDATPSPQSKPAVHPDPPSPKRQTGQASSDAAAGTAIMDGPKETPLDELLDQVIEGQKAALEETVTEDARPWLTDQELAPRAVKGAGQDSVRNPRKQWSLERLRGDIAGTSNEED
jgi:cell division initiation protein